MVKKLFFPTVSPLPRVIGHVPLCVGLLFPWGRGRPIFLCCARLAGARPSTVEGRGLLFSSTVHHGREAGGSLAQLPNCSLQPRQLHRPKILFIASVKTHPIHQIWLNPCIHSNFKATWHRRKVCSIKQCLWEVCMHNVICDLFFHTYRRALDATCINIQLEGAAIKSLSQLFREQRVSLRWRQRIQCQPICSTHVSSDSMRSLEISLIWICHKKVSSLSHRHVQTVFVCKLQDSIKPSLFLPLGKDLCGFSLICLLEVDSNAKALTPSNTALLFLISDYYFSNPIIILKTYHAFVVYIQCFLSPPLMW